MPEQLKQPHLDFDPVPLDPDEMRRQIFKEPLPPSKSIPRAVETPMPIPPEHKFSFCNYCGVTADVGVCPRCINEQRRYHESPERKKWLAFGRKLKKDAEARAGTKKI